jgi:nodulation protein E
MRRVVVTGMGVLSALGHGREAFTAALRNGQSGIGTLRGVDTSRLRLTVAAQVPDFDATTLFTRQQLHLLDRFTQLGLLAAKEALTQSDLPLDGAWRETAGALIGSCVGGQGTVDAGYVTLYREGKNSVSPFTVPRIMANAPASQISMIYGLRGPTFAVASACASANHALALAFQFVRSGAADVMVAGGTEAPLSFGHLKAWEALRVVAPDTCRPFSLDRRGMILGEGAAVLVLESIDHATARGAPVLGEIAGVGMSSDAGHITQPSADGAAEAMRRALADAGAAPDQVDYINAHGTGTRVNDATEARAIHEVFGKAATKLPVSSTKSAHGHTLGAAGAIEAAATLVALAGGFLPPTLGFNTPDPECNLDVVPNVARAANARFALSNSFAFGGLNAVLALRRWEEDRRV